MIGNNQISHTSSAVIRIPYVDIARSSREIWPTIKDEFERLTMNADFISGPAVAQLEALLAQKCETAEAVCCANGTDAIILALQAHGIGRGHRVAVPNLTFWASYEAIVQVGATPILLDVDPQHLQLDIEELVTAHRRFKIDACVLVHLFGWCHPQLKRFRDICRAEGIRLIEDGAQAFGVAVSDEQGRLESVFHGAETATLSFYPTKVLGGCMDGGAVVTNCSATAVKIRSLLNHGRKDSYSYQHVGWNSRMSSLQATYLNAAMRKIDDWLESRRRILADYANVLSGTGIELVTAPSGVVGNGYLAVLRLPPERVLSTQKILAEAGIGSARVYPETLHQQAPARDAVRHSGLEASSLFTQQVLNLPLFPGLSKSEQNEISNIIMETPR